VGDSPHPSHRMHRLRPVRGGLSGPGHLRGKRRPGKQDDCVAMQFMGLSHKDLPMVIKKGSIAVNGVSLTINDVSDNGFSVMLIPHTLERTNLKDLTVNAIVNIEFDYLARIIAKQLALREV